VHRPRGPGERLGDRLTGRARGGADGRAAVHVPVSGGYLEIREQALQLLAASRGRLLVAARHEDAELVAARVHAARHLAGPGERAQRVRDGRDEDVAAAGVVVREGGVRGPHAVEVEHQHAERIGALVALDLGLESALVGQAGERVDEGGALQGCPFLRDRNGQPGVVQ